MAHARPWYKRNGADFVMATLHFPDSDHKWAYSAILDMLNDRDRPLPDDGAFLCGFTGLSRKKWANVRRYLLETPSSSGEPYLQLTADGNITNPRFERERADRRADHAEAVEAGRRGGKASAAKRAGAAQPRQDRASFTPESMPESMPESRPIDARSEGQERQISANSDQPPPQAPCARKSPDKNNTQPNTPTEAVGEADGPGSGSVDGSQGGAATPAAPAAPPAPKAPSRLDDKNLQALFDAVCDAAGFNPIMPAAISRAYDQVKAWRDADINFDVVVIPTIKSTVASTDEPTRVLSRFDKAVRHQHARLKAKGEQGETYRAPPSPVLIVEGEPEVVQAIRADLLKVLGSYSYCLLFNDVRLMPVEDAGGGRKPLQVHDKRPSSMQVMNGTHAATLRSVAMRHGFTGVW